jgi:GH24 family phage-related lysozyme (muramidase)
MTGRMRISRAGLELIKAFEGFREAAARLPDGRWIIGYGHVRTAREGVTISEKDAEDLLKSDLRPVEDAVRSLVFAPLNPAQFDALVSLAFNISPGQFKDSDILRRLNEGDMIGAAGGFDAWRRARVNGRIMVVDALVRRRAAEKALFLAATDGRATAPTPVVIPEWDPSVGGGRAASAATAPDIASAIEKLAQDRSRPEPAAEAPAVQGAAVKAEPEIEAEFEEAATAEPEPAAATDHASEPVADPEPEVVAQPSTTPEQASRTVAERIARILERADKASVPEPAKAHAALAAKDIPEDLPDFSAEKPADKPKAPRPADSVHDNGRRLIDDTERFEPGRPVEDLFTDGLQAEKVANGRARKMGLMDNRTLRLAPFVAFLILSIVGLSIGLIEVFREDTRSITGASTVVAVFGLLTVMGIYFVAANASDADR